jgi:hypothetical protein
MNKEAAKTATWAFVLPGTAGAAWLALILMAEVLFNETVAAVVFVAPLLIMFFGFFWWLIYENTIDQQR